MKKVEKIEKLEKALERAKNCMHPDNFTLPMISEAAITVSSYGFNEDDKLVCTIPVPNITGKIDWRTELPRDKYVRGEGDEKGEWVAEEGWELQREDEEGEHWVLPEHKVVDYMVPERTCIIETREQYQVRAKVESERNISKILETAKAIREMYYACGDLVDQDVVVGVTLRDIDTLWSETYK